MTDQREKALLRAHAESVAPMWPKITEALTALLNRNKALEDWVKDADHHPGCSGSYGPCKCGLRELKRKMEKEDG